MQFPLQPGDHHHLKEGIRWWLQNHTYQYRNMYPSLPYSSSEEFILRETVPTPAMFGEMGSVPDMRMGKCFENAWDVSQINHRYRYFEGWAIMDHGIPTHHAWLWDTWNRKVEDPTWRQFYMASRAENPGQPWTGCAVYWGVPIHPLDHLMWANRTGLPNLLAINDDDCQAILLFGKAALGSRQAIDHNPPVVL